MQQLQQLADYAAKNHIRGSSFKRNSLLKPLTIILDELESYPEPSDLELVRAATKDMIFEHLQRISKSEFKIGKTKQDKVDFFVELFFNGVLLEAHQGKVNKLLSRERLLKSAYLVYYRQTAAALREEKEKATAAQK